VDVTAWAPATALCGVVVGSIVTFVGQSLSRRQTSSLSIAEQKAGLRKDRREAIYNFLQAAQTAYAVATTESSIEQGLITSKKTSVEAELLFRQKCIDVLCRPELRAAASQYAGAINNILWGYKPEGVKISQYIADIENAFFDIARKELYAPKVSD
jgi:hypothetical protein